MLTEKKNADPDPTLWKFADPDQISFKTCIVSLQFFIVKTQHYIQLMSK